MDSLSRCIQGSVGSPGSDGHNGIPGPQGPPGYSGTFRLDIISGQQTLQFEDDCVNKCTFLYNINTENNDTITITRVFVLFKSVRA